MALYTSYYTRQLALRPESIAAEQQNVEGEKKVQKSVARRTVDVTGPYLSWLEVSTLQDGTMLISMGRYLGLLHVETQRSFLLRVLSCRSRALLAWLQKRCLVRNPADIPGLHGTPAAALDLLPPIAYAHQPAVSMAIKFAAQAPSKTRSSVNVALWTPDGRRCLTGTQAGELCMWGGQAFQFETIIQAHETPVRTMVFTHSGNFLVSGDDAGNVRYWRTNLELVKSTAAHKEAVRQVAFSPTDLKFATASDDSTVRVWDFARVATEQVLAGHGGDVRAVDWHPSKSILASGSKDGLVKLWCPRSGKVLGTMQGHKGTVTAAQWNMNGNWVLTGSRDQTCKVYDIRMQAELVTFAGHGKDITQAAWHPLQEEMFVSGGHDGSMCFWLAGRQGPQAEVPAAHEGSIWALAWHPAGHLLATGAADAATKFWCRCRPGDPFFEGQQEEQAELAALAMAETAAVPVKAPAPSLFVPPPTIAARGAGQAAIPGIGEATARQAVAAMDVYAAAAAPVDFAPAASAAAGGYGPSRHDDDGSRRPYRDDRRSVSEAERDWPPPRGSKRPREQDRGPHEYHHRPSGRDRDRSPRRGRDRERSPPRRDWGQRRGWEPEPRAAPYAGKGEQPYHTAPAPHQYAPPPGAPSYGGPAPGMGYGAPSAPGYQQAPYPQQTQQYGAPPPGGPQYYGAPPAQQYGGLPQQGGYPPPYGQPPPQQYGGYNYPPAR